VPAVFGVAGALYFVGEPGGAAAFFGVVKCITCLDADRVVISEQLNGG